jgi:large subunit ribosomal protein L7/L12
MTTKTHEKLIEEIGNMSVLELSKLVKELEEVFGVTAAMPMMAAAPAAEGAAKPAEAKTAFKVTLKDAGAKRVDVIKAVKALTGLGLAESKAAVENAPTVLAEAAPKDKATEMKQKLEEAGAVVELS